MYGKYNPHNKIGYFENFKAYKGDDYNWRLSKRKIIRPGSCWKQIAKKKKIVSKCILVIILPRIVYMNLIIPLFILQFFQLLEQNILNLPFTITKSL